MTGLKVLLAEDNELNAEIAIVQLEELGMEITRACDGDQNHRAKYGQVGCVGINT